MSREGAEQQNGWVTRRPTRTRPPGQRPRRACSQEGRQAEGRQLAGPACQAWGWERRSSSALQAVPRNGTSPRTEEPGEGLAPQDVLGSRAGPGRRMLGPGWWLGAECALPCWRLAEGQDHLGRGRGFVGKPGSWTLLNSLGMPISGVQAGNVQSSQARA